MKVYMDFPAMLAIATLLAGLIWIIDTVFLKKRREGKEPKVVELAKAFFPILLAVFVLRAFFVEPFRIPSGSMKPTLLEGDFILVNKYIYGFRMPIFGTKLLDRQEPLRGDIVVFRYPEDTSIDYIKRVVGVPGDKIRYQNKTIYVNDKPFTQEYKETAIDRESHGINIPVKRYEETLDTNGKTLTHSIFVSEMDSETMEEITVPEGMYFAMGDNRDNSRDSRSWGFVPRDLMLGKAVFIWMSWDNFAKDVRWKRIGEKI